MTSRKTAAARKTALSAASPKDQPFSLVPASVQPSLLRQLRQLDSRGNALAVAEIASMSALQRGDIAIGSKSFSQHGACRLIEPASNPLERLASLFEALVTAPEKAVALFPLCGTAAQKRKAVSLAVRFRLPVLFLAASRYPLPKSASDLRLLQAELGIPVMTADANDAVALFRIATEAVHHARIGRGPTLIEAMRLTGAQASPSPLQCLQSYMRHHG
jgi:hypothetical protein